MAQTPKEKAKELVNRYWGKGITNDKEIAKQCALIAVDEIMQVFWILPYGMQYLSEIDYWEGVKQEINKQ